jgi:quercetin dioxygenase-like cupin family protein
MSIDEIFHSRGVVQQLSEEIARVLSGYLYEVNSHSVRMRICADLTKVLKYFEKDAIVIDKTDKKAVDIGSINLWVRQSNGKEYTLEDYVTGLYSQSRVHRLENFTKGWFLGDFVPSLFKTPDFEVAVKKYVKGDRESAHRHMIAMEWTVIVNGKVIFSDGKNDYVLEEGDIMEIFPGETFSFEALEDTDTVVVKSPSVSNDKYGQ